MPAGQIHHVASPVVEFDVFVVRIRADGIEHYFVDQDVSVLESGIVRSRRRRRQPGKAGGAVWKPAKSNSILLRAESKRINDPTGTGGLEKDALPCRRQGKTELILGVDQK